ncbi:MAG TPA: response regulator [Gemmatimonadales bacterium]|nr:response regulator [Gemmatimonadales bacterium]
MASAADGGEGEEVSKPLRGLPGRGELILVVDDDENLRVALARMLKTLGFSVVTAADGEDALEVIKRSAVRIDAVLLDVRMPQLDGPGLVDRLCSRGRCLPILYMSGQEENSPAMAGALDSGHPLLRKPFTPQALVFALREVLDTQSRSG